MLPKWLTRPQAKVLQFPHISGFNCLGRICHDRDVSIGLHPHLPHQQCNAFDNRVITGFVTTTLYRTQLIWHRRPCTSLIRMLISLCYGHLTVRVYGHRHYFTIINIHAWNVTSFLHRTRILDLCLRFFTTFHVCPVPLITVACLSP